MADFEITLIFSCVQKFQIIKSKLIDYTERKLHTFTLNPVTVIKILLQLLHTATYNINSLKSFMFSCMRDKFNNKFQLNFSLENFEIPGGKQLSKLNNV